MKDVRLVGLCGLIGAGKDATARCMRKYGFGPRDGFADDIKRAYSVIHQGEEIGGVFIRSWIDVDKVKHVPKVRRALQRIGQGEREDEPDYWVNRLLERVDRVMANDSSEKRVIADVRYGNEVDAIRKRGGKIVRVTRPDATPPEQSDIAQHISERALVEDPRFFPDAEIVNDGTLEELQAKVAALFGEGEA